MRLIIIIVHRTLNGVQIHTPEIIVDCLNLIALVVIVFDVDVVELQIVPLSRVFNLLSFTNNDLRYFI